MGSKRDIFLNLTLTGVVLSDHIKYRHGAKAGDMICITGDLGDSGGGLKALQEGLFKSKDIQYLIQRHFRPEPNLQEGIWLAAQEGVTALMDVSDGLDCDLRRLLQASQCGAVIETARIPLSHPLSQMSSEYNWDVLKLALSGGEDYCLLVTISEKGHDVIQRLFQEKFARPLHIIGQINDQPNQIMYQANGKAIKLDVQPYDHFR